MNQLSTRAPADGAPRFDEQLWERRLLPLVRALMRVGYFSLSVEGAEHLPAGDAPIVFAQNHAGWFPLDAFFVALAVRDELGPEWTPAFATHEAALALPGLGPFLRRVGAVPASWFRRPERLPRVGAYGIFPEGTAGNCKPFWEAYRMRPWNRGFVRVAAALGASIVPCAVLGGEECMPVAWTVRALEPLVGSIFGFPLAPVPLPSRWRIVFHAPIHLGQDARRTLTDSERSGAIARDVQRTVQETIDRHAAAYPLAHVSSWFAARQRLALTA